MSALTYNSLTCITGKERSRVQFPMRSLDFFLIDLILPAAL
jgi:hypothetical protein